MLAMATFLLCHWHERVKEVQLHLGSVVYFTSAADGSDATPGDKKEECTIM